MRVRPLIALAAVVALAGCTLPPIDTPHTTTTVKLSDMWSGAPANPTPIVVPPLPQFQTPVPPAISNPAASYTVPSAVLHMNFTDNMKIPLDLSVFLSSTSNPYSGTPIATVSLTPGNTTSTQVNLDPTLLKSSQLYTGVTIGSAGSAGQLVTVAGSDNIKVETWATAQVHVGP